MSEDRRVELASRIALEARFASGETSLSVRSFAVREAIAAPFEVELVARSRHPDLDLASIVGRPASFHVEHRRAEGAVAAVRTWSGVCIQMALTRVEADGMSTYSCRIVPALWLLAQRRDHRIFQHASAPEIIDEVLRPWGIEPHWAIDRAAFPKLPFKVQYGETDLGFLSRIAEEAGLPWTFPDDANGSRPSFSDRLGLGSVRAAPLRDLGTLAHSIADDEHVRNVRVAHRVAPGAQVVRDFDLRRPDQEVGATSAQGRAPEARLERFDYGPGAFLVESASPRTVGTPVADDRGAARHDDVAGEQLAHRALRAARADATVVRFETNAVDLGPGVVFLLAGSEALAEGETKLLVTASELAGTVDGEWEHVVVATFADEAYRPPRRTERPRIVGVQSAVVVGPRGQEIHTDELGRVRLQFPWDRRGRFDDASSCWIRVSQGWGGASFGMTMLPRIGQEVLVGFLDGDPEQPVVVGRGYNAAAPVPHPLPRNRTFSTWKSDSSPGSGGFNEIRYEDDAGEELFYTQAEKNLRKLVKHDETITVLRDRTKDVGATELDTTLRDRAEVTRARRRETTYGDRATDVRGTRRKQIAHDESEQTGWKREMRVTRDLDVVTEGTSRERVEVDSHLRVNGHRRDAVEGSDARLVVGDQHERVEGADALHAGDSIHILAGDTLCIESADISLNGPGGFVRVDGGGVTISGTMVHINAGGSPMTGRGVQVPAPLERNPPLVLEDQLHGDDAG